MKFSQLALVAFLVAPMVGCSSTDGIGASSHDTTEIPAGYHSLDANARYFDIAVGEERAYLVNGRAGVNEIDVVDLRTRQVVDSWPAIDAFPAVPASEQDATRFRSDLELSGVQVLDDGQVVVFGRRDDAYPRDIVGGFLDPTSGRWQFSFVVQGLSDDGRTAEWSVGLDLRGAVRPSSSIVQREKMSAYVTDDTIAITFSHIDRTDRVITIPRPSGHEMVQLTYDDAVDLPAAAAVNLAYVDTPRDIVAEGDGSFLVTGSDGLFRVDTQRAVNLAPQLSFDDGHYLTELRVVDGLALVADHGVGVQVLSASTGSLIHTVELDHYERGLDASAKQIFVGEESGVTAIPIAWDAGDAPGGDAPDDPGGDEDDDSGVDVGGDQPIEECAWGWEWVAFGFGGYWDWTYQCD